METRGPRAKSSSISGKGIKHYARSTVTRDTTHEVPHTETPQYWQGPRVKRYGWRSKERKS